MPFAHEKLDVYKLALDVLVLADDIVEHFPRGRGHLSDQLSRPSTSGATACQPLDPRPRALRRSTCVFA